MKNKGQQNGDGFPGKGQSGETVFRFTEDEFRAFLKSLVEKEGFIADFAPKLGVTPQFLGQVISGKRKPGPAILERLNAKAIRLYEIIVEGE